MLNFLVVLTLRLDQLSLELLELVSGCLLLSLDLLEVSLLLLQLVFDLALGPEDSLLVRLHLGDQLLALR